MELRKPGFSTVKQQANTHKISFKKNKKRYLCMYLLIYLFIYSQIYNKGGKTHWRLAGRCPLGVSVCRRHWNCVSMASGYELTSKHTQNQFKKKVKKKKRYLCMYLLIYLNIYI